MLLQRAVRKMVQLADLFSVPEMYLMSVVTEYFNRNHIDYHPEILFRDVKVGDFDSTRALRLFPKDFFLFSNSQNAVGSSHPVMHGIVGDNVKEYIKYMPDLRKFLERLVNANKKLFLVTNSPFHFV